MMTNLVGDWIEEGVDDTLGETSLQTFVHINHLLPVGNNFREVETVGEVDEVENIFWRQDPPKPTEASTSLGPIRLSLPTACATSSILAPVASQMAERALVEDMRPGSMALAASLESSVDQRPAVRMRSLL